jgi:hypothetical protein
MCTPSFFCSVYYLFPVFNYFFSGYSVVSYNFLFLWIVLFVYYILVAKVPFTVCSFFVRFFLVLFFCQSFIPESRRMIQCNISFLCYAQVLANLE